MSSIEICQKKYQQYKYLGTVTSEMTSCQNREKSRKSRFFRLFQGKFAENLVIMSANGKVYMSFVQIKQKKYKHYQYLLTVALIQELKALETNNKIAISENRSRSQI